jgi:hypothetical protein
MIAFFCHGSVLGGFLRRERERERESERDRKRERGEFNDERGGRGGGV